MQQILTSLNPHPSLPSACRQRSDALTPLPSWWRGARVAAAASPLGARSSFRAGAPRAGMGARGATFTSWGTPRKIPCSPSGARCTCRAEHGEPGQGSDMHGQGGKDISVSVPPGTVVWARDAAAGDPPLGEVLAPGQRVLIARGGKGGRGNLAFKTARNTAPALAEHGERGQGEESAEQGERDRNFAGPTCSPRVFPCARCGAGQAAVTMASPIPPTPWMSQHPLPRSG